MFTIHVTPTHVTARIGDVDVPCSQVIVEAAVGHAPAVTLTPLDGVVVEGDGVVRVPTQPDPETVVDAARELVNRIDLMGFENACKARLQTGARNPFEVALAVLKEAVDG